MSTKVSAAPIRPSSRRLVGVVAIALAALVLTGCLSEQGQRSFDLINQERRARGIHEVGNDLDLNATAQAWAEHMAATGVLGHSNLQIPPGSTRVTENVGYGGSVDSIHARLMESAGHRANILDTKVTRVGIGSVVGADGRVWIVQLFAN